MDDQDNKKGYDDFFRNNEEEKDESGKGLNEASQANPQDFGSPDSQEQSVKPSYYYSYGPSKTNPQQEGHTLNQPPVADQAQLIQDQPYGTTGARTYSNENNGDFEQRSEQQQAPQQLQQQSQTRAFSPSQSSGKGTWKVQEKPRRTSFLAIFASFLVGVILVGTLMYAADTSNWFTDESAMATQTQGNGSGGTSAGTSGTNGNDAATVAGRPENIAGLFETASPAVVKIETYIDTAKQNSGGNSMLDDPFFRQFFGDDYSGKAESEKGKESKMQQNGIGTGFFFDSTGYILTNQHVIGEADQIKVTVQGYKEPFTAELLGSSFELDLAVLKVTNDKEFPTLPLGKSDDINIGDWVVAIGNPYGFDHTVTVGVLSAKERPIDIQDTQGQRNYEHLLQTDASINPGNSGGPLLNVDGEVIGINTAVSSQAQGIGFAIPTSTIEGVLDSLKSNVKIPKPFIGAELQDVSAEFAKQLGMDKVEGSIVRNVYYNSPAYLAGVQQFDVIVGIDGKKYNTTTDLIAEIQKKTVGEKVKLNILRKGTATDVQVEIGDKNTFSGE